MSKWLAPTAQRVTATLDANAASMFGGRLERAMFAIYECTTRDLTLDKQVDQFEFFINPNTIHIDKEVEFKETPTQSGTNELSFATTKPLCLELGEMWFDTYDTRESVRAVYIDKLEKLLDYQPGTHHLHVIKFVWGQFAQSSKVEEVYTFLMSKLSVDYTLFLPSGMPCRAKVAVCMRQIITNKKEHVVRPKESPDHARIYTVKRGDTLQGIARFAYDDPREWRRIADSNRILDPMRLLPGKVLLLPPILK